MSLAQLGRLLRLALGDPGPSQDSVPAADTPSRLLPEGPNAPDAAVLPAERAGYLAWLLAADTVTPMAWPPHPACLLRAADAEIHGKGSCTKLLRRSPSVLPRLIRILRNETYTRAELARHIEQDVVLTAEVLRMARSALYAQFGGGSPSVQHAVAVLGSAGVEQVIARVLVRPLYQSETASLQARASARMWEESERCATVCAMLAHRYEQDMFDAYVAGLLLNTGWNAMLRAFELHLVEPALQPAALHDPALQEALTLRRDRLLARLMPAWDLSPRLTALARSLEAPAGAPRGPLHDLLAHAQGVVMRRRVDELAAAGEPPPPIANQEPQRPIR
jgi:HD-like signal output (HDOD) protein